MPGASWNNFGPIHLDNPIVVASCPATETIGNLRRCRDGGAAAAILKSCHTCGWTPAQSASAVTRRFYWVPGNSLAYWGNSTLARELLPPESAMDLLSHAQELAPMRVIPSVAGAGLNPEPWLATLHALEPLNPVAIQLDFFYCEQDLSLPESVIQMQQLLKLLVSKTRIPLLPKLNQEIRPGVAVRIFADLPFGGLSLLDSLRYRIPARVLRQYPCELQANGSASRFGAFQFPMTMDYLLRLRDSRIRLPLWVGGGVATAEDVCNLLGEGAQAVQVASAILTEGPSWISRTLSVWKAWADDCASVLPAPSRRRARICSKTCCGCGRCWQQTMCEHICQGKHGRGEIAHSCEGCGFCQGLCHSNAISMECFA